MKKLLLAVIFLVVIFTGCAQTSTEPCVYCGNTPSKAYIANGKKSYVCADCSSDCFFCGDKATTHYENITGEVSFACENCYDSMSE